MMIKMNEWKGVEISQAHIDEMITEVVNMARGRSNPIAYIMTGDTLVMATNHEGEEVQVTVAKVVSRGYEYDPQDDPDILHI